MASYTLNLTPDLINLGTEGSLDTSILNGVSLQRTGYVDTLSSTGERKVSEMADGAGFTDVAQTPTGYDNGNGGNWIV